MSNFTSKSNYWLNGTVEVGDSKQTELYAQMKFMQWDNEGNLSIRLDSDNCGNNFKNVTWTVTETLTEIRLTYDFIQLRFYKVIDSRFEHKSPEMETVLLKTPKGYDGSKLYELYYTVESKGLEYFYQDALTKDETDIGDNMPDWAIGSYAVYFDKKNNKYKTGKFCHLPRAEMVLPNNSTIINPFEIANKKLTVTISENLNKLSYPLRHVSGLTLGYTSKGATSRNASVYDYGCEFSLGSNATLNTFYLYIAAQGASNNFKCAVWDSGSSTHEANGLGSVTGINWMSASLSSASVNSGTKRLAVSVDGSTNTFIKSDTGSNNWIYRSNNYSSFPYDYSNFTGLTSRIFSMWVDATESGGSTPTPKLVMLM